MPNTQIYEEELEKFQKEYNVPRYNLEKIMDTDDRFGYFNNTKSSTSAQLYARLATTTISVCLEAELKLKETGRNDLSKIHWDKFLNDFENLVDSLYCSKLEKPEEYNRKKYEGANPEDVRKSCHARAVMFNKPVPTLWKENLKFGATKVEKMQETTDRIYEKLSNQNAVKDELQGELASIVAAHEAMRQLRESRRGIIGFFWKLFNKEQNLKEEQYCNTLATQLDNLENQSGYDVSNVREDVLGKTAFGKHMKGARRAKAARPAEAAKSTETEETKVADNTNTNLTINNENIRTNINVNVEDLDKGGANHTFSEPISSPEVTNNKNEFVK